MALNSKLLFRIGFASVILFVLVASYFWYLYFHNYEQEIQGKNVALEFVNSGHIDYINAQISDPDELIPTYYFQVRNHLNKEFEYDIILNRINPSEISDGCDETTTYKADELLYELKLDNKLLKTGLLSEIKDGILDTNKIKGYKTNNYSLQIRLSDYANDNPKMHYHYVVNFKEK